MHGHCKELLAARRPPTVPPAYTTNKIQAGKLTDKHRLSNKIRNLCKYMVRGQSTRHRTPALQNYCLHSVLTHNLKTFGWRGIDSDVTEDDSAIFQLDGIPPHYSDIVRERLNKRCLQTCVMENLASLLQYNFTSGRSRWMRGVRRRSAVARSMGLQVRIPPGMWMYVVRMGDSKGAYRVWWGDLREGLHLEDLDVEGRIILKLILKKWNVEAWTESIWFRIGTGGGHLCMR